MLLMYEVCEELKKNLAVYDLLKKFVQKDVWREEDCVYGSCKSIAVLTQLWRCIANQLFKDASFRPEFSIMDFNFVYGNVPVVQEESGVYLMDQFIQNPISDYVGYYYKKSKNWEYECHDVDVAEIVTSGKYKEYFWMLFGNMLDEEYLSVMEQTDDMEKPEKLLEDCSEEEMYTIVLFKSYLLAWYEKNKSKIPAECGVLKKIIDSAISDILHIGNGMSYQMVTTANACYMVSLITENTYDGYCYYDDVGIFGMRPSIMYAGKIIDECIVELKKWMLEEHP